MANPTQIVAKIARNAMQLGLTVVSQSFDANGIALCVISNGSNNLTVSYLPAQIQSPMAGVNPNNSPFLGIGDANPGLVTIKSSIDTAGSMADIIDGAVAAQVLQLVSGLANSILLANSATTISTTQPPGYPPYTASVGGAGEAYNVLLQGSSDWIGLGQ